MLKWLYIDNAVAWLATSVVIIFSMKIGFGWQVIWFMLIPMVSQIASQEESKDTNVKKPHDDMS